MKLHHLLLAAGAAVAWCAASASSDETPSPKKPARLAIGAAAVKADVQMEGIDGKRRSIESSRGEKGTLVLFSCNHCPVVIGYETRIAKLLNEYKDKGIGVIVINSNDAEAIEDDSLENMKVRAKERGFEFPYVMDDTSDVARAFGATKTPEAFLFDKDLKLAYYGAIDDSPRDADAAESHYLKDAMDALIAGRKIETPETRAVGCSIKLRPARKAPEETRRTGSPSSP